jgi:hypothetical protein
VDASLTSGRRTCLLAAVLLLGSAACGGDDDSAATTTTTRAQESTTSTSEASDEEAAVLDAYEAFWDAYLEAADPMVPQHRVLQEHATGEQLQQVTGAFLARLSAGEVIRGEIDLAPVVVELTDSTATVSDCYLDRSGVFDAETGERLDQESGVRHLVTAELRFEDGSWKVASMTREGDGCTPETTS